MNDERQNRQRLINEMAHVINYLDAIMEINPSRPVADASNLLENIKQGLEQQQ